jgi:hypothetical protein
MRLDNATVTETLLLLSVVHTCDLEQDWIQPGDICIVISHLYLVTLWGHLSNSGTIQKYPTLGILGVRDENKYI